MALSKKGTRKIEVDGNHFLYKISKLKSKTDWRAQKDELDDTFMKHARHYGLGNVKDASIHIVIQSATNPISKMYIACHTLIVDGFMGPEQIIQITPKLISILLKKGIKNGWDPTKKEDFKMEIIQKNTHKKKPVILEFPHGTSIKDYENLNTLIEIHLNE